MASNVAVAANAGGEAIGCALAAIDTPALLLDLDALGRNIERMAAFARGRGLALRPHAKTHKSPVIAQLQIAAGAVGVCCQKVGEAEVLAAGGVRDILIANEVVGAAKLARVAGLARFMTIAVAIDDE
jgi:D-serine deaminase-like pyridoxal phosphate-dependent protein